MEFLKAIYGDKALTYEELLQAINAHNGDEANTDNQIKIGNLGSGEYTSTAKYKALQDAMSGKDAEITNANNLIEELKKAAKGNEEMQQKFTDYEAEKVKLQEELQETKVKAAIKVGLLEEHCTDVDYVTFKLMESLKEKGETLELDENDSIKGWNDKVSGLKTQLPAQFTSASGKKMKVLNDVDSMLGGNTDPATVTKEAFDKMGYKSRVELRESNPELYAQLTK